LEKLLTINPGSTSTKIAIFDGEKEIFESTIRHSKEELSEFEAISDQKTFRKEVILKELEKANLELSDLKAVVGRGGLLKPISGGTYRVDERMLADLKMGVLGEHASNLGGIIANEIAKDRGVEALIVDPVVVDELKDVARVSGFKGIDRKSIFHALNQKAVARRYAKKLGKSYEELNLIVVHMGGGVSVGAHNKGKVVDVNNALDGDGPFSPERSGGVPAGDLVKLCFSGKYTQAEIKKKLKGEGGISAYLDTNDMRDVISMSEEGNSEATIIRDAFSYQVSKEIGAMASVLLGEVDAVILTGGIAYSNFIISEIEKRIKFIAPIIVYPGEKEMDALAEGALRVLRGEEEPKVY